MSRIMLDKQQSFEGLWDLPEDPTGEKREDEVCKEVAQVKMDNDVLATETALEE